MRRFLILLAAVCAPLGTAWAEPDAPCSGGNLLADRSPTWWRDVYRPEMVTDGILARDGDPERGTRSAVLGPAGAVLTYDLGASFPVTAAVLQASARGAYAIDLSEDGQAWRRLMAVGPARGSGLATRMAKSLDGRGRYLRLVVEGAGTVGVSELQIFCRAPAMLPISVRSAQVVSTPAKLAQAQSRHALLLLVPAGLAIWVLSLRTPSRRRGQAALALSATSWALALAFAASGLSLGISAACGGAMTLAAVAVAYAGAKRRAAIPSHANALSAALLIGVAAMAYTNYGRFGGYWSVHYHDVLHYVLGAKYAPELRYDGLYTCLLRASAEERRWSGLSPRVVRDLHDNRLLPAAEVAARADCQSRFTQERWLAFQRDATFFMGQLSPRAWVAVFADHGYNATPVWTWLWRSIFNRVPVSARVLGVLAHVDEVAYASMVLLLIWAWGLERAALAGILFGFGFPWLYQWTGGGVGRSLWLLALVAASAFIPRRRFVLAGIALGLSGALRLFPVLVLAGPFVLALRRSAGDETAHARRLLVAAVLTGATLCLLSLLVAGPALWIDFARNTMRQAASNSANRIGAGVVAAHLIGGGLSAWALPAVTLACWLWAALRVRGLARSLSLSVLVPIFAAKLSSYYLAMVVALVPVLVSFRRVPAALLVLLIIPHVIALFAHGNPGPRDYAWMSLAIAAFGTAICVLETRARHDEAAAA